MKDIASELIYINYDQYNKEGGQLIAIFQVKNDITKCIMFITTSENMEVLDVSHLQVPIFFVCLHKMKIICLLCSN